MLTLCLSPDERLNGKVLSLTIAFALMLLNRSYNVDDDTAHYNFRQHNHCNHSKYNNRHDRHYNFR
jgi:hypothetical protein